MSLRLSHGINNILHSEVQIRGPVQGGLHEVLEVLLPKLELENRRHFVEGDVENDAQKLDDVTGDGDLVVWRHLSNKGRLNIFNYFGSN